VCYIVFSVCTDDTGSCYLQGFIKTSVPVNMEMLINLCGPAIYTLGLNQTPILTEIYMNSFVYEFGNVNLTNFKQTKAEIKSFKADVDTTIKNVKEEIQRKYFDFFQRNPNLVLRYLHN
jgi:hypothetical protein